MDTVESCGCEGEMLHCVCVCVYVCVCVCVCLCLFVFVRVCIYVCADPCLVTRLHVLAHAFVPNTLSQGHAHMVDVLLEEGADPTFTNSNGRTPRVRPTVCACVCVCVCVVCVCVSTHKPKSTAPNN